MKLGTTAISTLKLGSAQVSKAYLSGAVVWSALDSDVAAFAATTGATDLTVLNQLSNYLKAQSLWTSCRFAPWKSTQNYPTGTVVAALGGWTSNHINLFGSVANPTTAGRLFDATDDRGTWDMTGVEGLSELYVFDRQKPTNASLADTQRFGATLVGDTTSTGKFFYLGGVSSAIATETALIGLSNGIGDNRRMGTTQTWSAGADTHFVSRLAQTGSDIWLSKATTTKVTPSGTQDYRPSQSGWTTNSIVNVSALWSGSAYSGFVATTRIALLLCKTSLTTLQRETITDYLDSL